MASNIRSRNQSNWRYDDLDCGSSMVEYETAQEIEIEAEEDAYRLYEKFNCTSIPTPRIFENFSRSSTEMEAALDGLISQISMINRTRNMEKANGSALSFTGGLLGIAGTIAAPFTLGGSLLLAGTGIAMSIGGSQVSSKAETRMKSEINSKLQEAQAHLNDYNNQMKKWTVVAKRLSEIVEDLQKVFHELGFSFGNLVRSIENVTYDDRSSYGTECILKCVSTFYGVARQSSHVVRNVEHIARLTLRVRQVKTVIQTGKKAAGFLRAVKGIFLRGAIGKPQVAFTATKQVMTSGRHVISAVEKTRQVSMSAKMVSTVVDGTGKVVKTERTVQAVGTSITREASKVTKNVSRLGLALGVIFAAVDLYQFDKAVTASKATCDAEKDIRSCKENLKESASEVMAQVETFRQVLKINAFFQYLFEDNKHFKFGNESMPLEQVRACMDKINTLCEIMSFRNNTKPLSRYAIVKQKFYDFYITCTQVLGYNLKLD